MKYEKKSKIQTYKRQKPKAKKKVMLQASSFLITIIDIYFKNINHSPFFFILFPLLNKYAKKLDKKELPRTCQCWTAFLSGQRSPNNKHCLWLVFSRNMCTIGVVWWGHQPRTEISVLCLKYEMGNERWDVSNENWGSIKFDSILKVLLFILYKLIMIAQ